ncbi:uncharacterized protein KNAG_0F02900 [Huiozyma naganishii CBS 8797]|uniref:Protein kinase domain-containing protein n=1 Tax=Huiozyma naganishii (strain ATCC MYA-139 / BCRC 22969 / CBS 8797 / KCTC 17520 / NBRC 10181 / NCYC 3082 / Yp74L-3) TaxID=1071383 RepID=J7S0A0_HUIN7|nr:hypothetical protein KNAG_0F02900 [Kazachstania naganishii CBS 8797]CCK70952.1 hypothetical protein KNAG_0F02900 [Kazachstania naganishii CBS 8797]
MRLKRSRTNDSLFDAEQDSSVTKRVSNIIELRSKRGGKEKVYYRGSEINRGSHSVVYKVFDSEDRIFAGKKVHCPNKENKRKIIKELEIYKVICRSHHNHIVALRDAFQWGKESCIYMILDYCSNNSLQSILQYRGSLNEVECKELMIQLCGGIYWLHLNNVIHGDLKLSNILFDEGQQLKICDFGSSFIATSSPRGPGEIMGTPYYLAPETVYTHKNINKSGMAILLISFPIDIWSMGIVLYSLLYGINPFIKSVDELHNVSLDELMQRITSGVIEFPTNKAVGAGAQQLILKMLSQNPLERITLVEIVCDPWIRFAFTNNAPQFGLNKLKTNSEQSLLAYLGCVRNANFQGLLGDKGDTSQSGRRQLKTLLKNAKKYREKTLKVLREQYGLPTVRLPPVAFVNELTVPLTAEIIKNELQVVLRNICEAQWAARTHRTTLNPTSTDDSPTQSPILVHKYKFLDEGCPAVSYELTNGQFGTMWKQGHSVVIRGNSNKFWYVVPDAKLGWISKSFESSMRSKLPAEITRRVSATQDLKLEFGTSTEPAVHLATKEVFLRDYMICESPSGISDGGRIELFELSNGTLQVNFVGEKSTMVLSNRGRCISVITPSFEVYNENLASFLNDHAGDSELSTKMLLINEILTRRIGI